MPTKLPLLYYREYGVRKVGELLSPKVIDVTDLPRQSTYHYCSFDPEACDIDTSLKLLNVDAAQRIFVDYVTELTSTEGNPRRVAFQINTAVRPFFRENRKFKRQVNAAELNVNEKILTVLNYNYLQKVYAYVDTKWSHYYQWKNIAKTMFANVNALCSKSTFNHYLEFEIPKDIPSRGLLTNATNNFTTSMLSIFDTVGERMVFELWKWLDPEHAAESIFSEIEISNLSRVNLIFKASNGKTSLINLGYLHSWIDGNTNLTPIKSLNTKRWSEVRKSLLYFMIVLSGVLDQEGNTEVIPEATGEDSPSVQSEFDLENKRDAEMAEEEDDNPNPLLMPVAKQAAMSKNIEMVSKIDKGDDDFTFDTDRVTTEDLDKILEDMEKVTKMRMKQRGIKIDDVPGSEEGRQEEKDTIDAAAVEAMIFTRPDNTEMLRQKVENDVSFGMLTAADMRKINKDIDAYVKMPDPYGSGKTITEAKVIKPEELKIDEAKSTIVTSHIVPDESMKKSSLLNFHEDYSTKIIKKDILSMVDGLQRGGVIVRDYQVKTEFSELGDYEVHSVELKPIDGAASTIHFKLPKIEKDGTFVNNGNKYIARMQRSDLPIRKISPSVVALSSYYGKTFVSLDDRKANSERDYIVRKIAESALLDGTSINKVAPANVYDSGFTAPFIYSVLSASFRLISVKGNLLDFDHTSREVFVGTESLAKYEKAGAVVVGQSAKKFPIIIDLDNVFWEITPVTKNRLGDIYELCDIDRIAAPVEYAFTKVYAKEIPVGVYLAYYIGFSNLLKLLKAKYRVVAPRKQKDLKPNEYAITFMDGSYIFDRNERKNSLILGGFTVLEKQLKRVEVADLDTRDPYLGLLNPRGITSIHFKEMDCVQDYFIDPITLEILKEMGEPQTFNGLLIRATELLLTYYHPKTQDLQYMRFRGYERMAGYAYGTMVQAIRSFKTRNISGKSKIDMSPFEVWNTFLKDESIKIVEDINPIQNLKEKEVVTYTGGGGRAKDSMPMGMRAMDISDVGIISEANIDSGDAGINTYMVPNPELANLRGITTPRNQDKKDILEHGSSSILSTSGLLAPMVYTDD